MSEKNIIQTNPEAAEDDVERTVKKAVRALADTLEREGEERFSEVLDTLVKQYPTDKVSVEDFATLISFDILERLGRAAAVRYFPEAKQSHRLMYFIQNYLMMERILKRLFDSVPSTSMNTADYARWVLRHYESFVRSVQKPDEEKIKKETFYPGFGDMEDWLRFCDAMLLLPFGDAERYLNIETRLLANAQDVQKGGRREGEKL